LKAGTKSEETEGVPSKRGTNKKRFSHYWTCLAATSPDQV